MVVCLYSAAVHWFSSKLRDECNSADDYCAKAGKVDIVAHFRDAFGVSANRAKK